MQITMKWFIPNFVYKLYEKKLHEDIKDNIIPRHIGIILDGNRRGSKKLGLDYKDGYDIGARKLEEVLGWCWDLGVEIVTCWVFSTENFDRDEEQVNLIMKLAEEKMVGIRKDSRTHENKLRVKVLGRLSMLPESVQEEIKKTEEATKGYDKYLLNICMAYGGRAEIVDAMKDISKKIERGEISSNEVNEDLVNEHMYTNGIPDPDLIIRTSGEERLSGFLLWQSAYAEYYFADAYWPLFRKIDFWRAVRTYQQRNRRFGK